ncbi:hypothetical protein AFLA_001408 [Aspergillus flavus NRRL3357]|nr:hypothetical protein AFLA_001408 [Aspergillus flavus NRRL3357]
MTRRLSRSRSQRFKIRKEARGINSEQIRHDAGTLKESGGLHGVLTSWENKLPVRVEGVVRDQAWPITMQVAGKINQGVRRRSSDSRGCSNSVVRRI